MENRDGRTTTSLSHLQSVQDAGWLLLAILPPLWLNLWSEQPFELSKVLLVRTLVWLLAAVVLAGHLLRGRSLWHRLRANPLAGPVALLALALVVTTATAANPTLSLWGSYDRGQGAVTLLTYLLLFLLGVDRFHSPAAARRMVAAMAAAGVPLVLLGFLQSLGWNPAGLVSDARSPVFATLGRANFLGAYLAMLAPPTLALALTSARSPARRIWYALFVGLLLVTALTLARGAWLATAVTLSLFALLWWGSWLAGRWRALAWGSVSLLFLAAPIAVLWLGQRQLGSPAARLAIWRGTLELIGQRPLLGYGPDALGVAFPRVYPPGLVYTLGRHFFVDRAHNFFLDWAVTTGLPGLLAILLVFVAFAVVAGRALRRPLPAERRALLIAALAAVAGNVANNLVSFDVTPTATATWLLMAIGVALATKPDVTAQAPAGKRPFRSTALATLLLLGVFAGVWQFNARPLLASVAARSAARYARAGQREHSVAAAEVAVQRWPAEPAHHLTLSRALWQQAVADPASAPVLVPRAEAALLAARRLRPDDAAVWLQDAHFYTASAREFGARTRAQAAAAFRQALALAPNDAALHMAWGRAHLQAGNAEAAAPLLRRAVQLDASNGEAYLHLGATELALGRLEIALADYQEALRLLPQSSQAYAGLAHCYWRLGRPQEALFAVERALRYDPQNAEAITIRREIYSSPSGVRGGGSP